MISMTISHFKVQQPIYKGEAMLLRWSDNSTNGRTVTFTIEDGPDASKEHPFKGLPCGKEGQRFAIVAVPLGEAEHPDFKDDNSHNAKDEKPRKSWNELSRSQQAGILCADPKFRDWLVEGRAECSEQDAVTIVRQHCCVESRSQLDQYPMAGGVWDRMVARYRTATGQMAESR